jgi:hypothetical protein
MTDVSKSPYPTTGAQHSATLPVAESLSSVPPPNRWLGVILCRACPGAPGHDVRDCDRFLAVGCETPCDRADCIEHGLDLS